MLRVREVPGSIPGAALWGPGPDCASGLASRLAAPLHEPLGSGAPWTARAVPAPELVGYTHGQLVLPPKTDILVAKATQVADRCRGAEVEHVLGSKRTWVLGLVA